MRLLPFVLLAVVSALRLVGGELPIEPYDIDLTEKVLLEKAKALKDGGKLLNRAQVVSALATPKPEPLVLLQPGTQKLEPRDIAARARAALLRIGWYYLEKDTNEWHLNLAGGYALSSDGVAATCHHCVSPEDIEMKEGYLVASDTAGNMYAVQSVIAADAEMDCALVRVDGRPFAPLALSDQAMPGDSVYCYSDPLGVAGYFSTGIVNRYFWNQSASGDEKTIEGARKLRVHVSTDWAPGSSGAAVLDCFGNAIGHVSSIETLLDEDLPPPTPKKAPKTPRNKDEKGGKPGKKQPRIKEPPPERTPLLTLHEAVSARSIKRLLDGLSKQNAAPEKP